MRPDIVPGAIFPDYELSDHTGKHRKLSELQGPHPMVLVLSRGGYCASLWPPQPQPRSFVYTQDREPSRHPVIKGELL
jgi:hypothetical protein